MPSTLIASRPLRYNARALMAGEEFQASDRDARLLIALGQASPKVPPPVQAKPVVSPTADPAPLDRPKRQYRRRDVAAAPEVFVPESAPVLSVPPVPVVEQHPPERAGANAPAESPVPDDPVAAPTPTPTPAE